MAPVMLPGGTGAPNLPFPLQPSPLKAQEQDFLGQDFPVRAFLRLPGTRLPAAPSGPLLWAPSEAPWFETSRIRGGGGAAKSSCSVGDHTVRQLWHSFLIQYRQNCAALPRVATAQASAGDGLRRVSSKYKCYRPQGTYDFVILRVSVDMGRTLYQSCFSVLSSPAQCRVIPATDWLYWAFRTTPGKLWLWRPKAGELTMAGAVVAAPRSRSGSWAWMAAGVALVTPALQG